MQKTTSKPQSSAATAVAPALSNAELLGRASNPEDFCVVLAKMFRVRKTEVALLHLEKGLLKFIYPQELKTAGAIPVSSSAIAAHTATTKKVELFNNFTRVKHVAIFETVRLAVPENNDQSGQSPIQKLVSAPILDADGNVLGVIQICRKAYDLVSAGPDFTLDDLQQVEAAANILARKTFLQ